MFSLLKNLKKLKIYLTPLFKRAHMESLTKSSIQQVQLAAKSTSTVPWRDSFDKPWPQPWYGYNATAKNWAEHSNGEGEETCGKEGRINRLALYSWNIDFMLPFPNSRMIAALAHLKTLIIAAPDRSDVATIIHLGECLTSDLKLLAADPWVQASFYLTDLSSEFWQSRHYGTTTLIDKRLVIRRCFRVHFSQTRMERDGLFVDVDVGGNGGVLRFCNTHLESLALEPAYRPAQLALCARFMNEPAVSAAVLAGDLNAIQDFDRTLHSESGLADAFLESGGNENNADGHTWGQQAATNLREQFGTSRMDKVFFCGEALRLEEFGRFGAGVEVADDAERQTIVKLGFERPWVTDHLGVRTVFEIV